MAIESRTPQPDVDGVSRRSVIRTAAVAGAVALAGVGLAACGDSGDSADSAGTGTSPGTNPPPTDSPETTPDGGAAAAAIANTADIPVGGGKVVKAGGQPIVVTQPAAGDFKAFSAICTHQGCEVNKIENGTIVCPCHNSRYSAEDGSVTGGPAPRALAKFGIKVEGDSIVPA
jgi:Rieske Fe-S protein